MRDHSKHIEFSRDNAVANILKALPDSFGAEAGVQHIAVADSFGRVLAEDVLAKADDPNCLTCALDSIALHWDDIANLPDGQLPDTSNWVRGREWEFANTGVAMPDSFDTAIVIENADVSEDEQHVTINALPSERFAGTRAQGSKHKRGDIIASKGALITSDIAAIIAGAGVSSIDVVAKPRVAFIPTGDELVPPNLPFSESAPERYAGAKHVFETNSIVVEGKVDKWGGTYVPFDIVPDDRDAIREAVRHACEVADIVVLNAGSSKGSDDWSVEVLEDMGEIICHQTNHGPGHHSSYAIVNGIPIVGISGPSGGASFTLDFYLRPLMKKFLGLNPEPERIPAVLAEAFPAGHKGNQDVTANKKRSGESRPSEATEAGAKFYSIRFLTLAVNDEGILTATPVPGKPGSAQTQHANAYYMMPSGPGQEPPAVGSVIPVELR